MQPPPALSSSSDTTLINNKFERLRSLLQQVLRITAKDGRVFLGTFAGTDKSLNVLLINTEEYSVRVEGSDVYEGRFVGQVLVPWKEVVKVEVQTSNEPTACRDGIYI
ncbi:hypothetical protein CC2G_001318 [Coprinopsis cinerea AmutBmut pab1-1]|nr:hypothetical protein CC2G_001318 [Coprinopsis cinerea AmutBmut pab1-1]